MSNMIINDMDKNWARLIVVYGLTKEQIKEIEESVTIKDCEVYSTECFTDTIALPLMASIVVWSALSKDDKAFFVEYYSDVVLFAETVILIGDVGVDIPKDMKKRFSIYSSYEKFASNMKYDVLNAFRKAKKNEDFSRYLSNALIILKRIQEKPYITTKELAEDRRLEMTERTVQRYIETLRVAGEGIEYDIKRKGWKLQCDGMSILSGEIFEKDSAGRNHD